MKRPVVTSEGREGESNWGEAWKTNPVIERKACVFVSVSLSGLKMLPDTRLSLYTQESELLEGNHEYISILPAV